MCECASVRVELLTLSYGVWTTKAMADDAARQKLEAKLAKQEARETMKRLAKEEKKRQAEERRQGRGAGAGHKGEDVHSHPHAGLKNPPARPPARLSLEFFFMPLTTPVS